MTDLGETIRWIESQSVSGMRSDKQKELIEIISLTHNLEVKRDMFITRVDSSKDSTELATSVLELAQALVRLSDLWILQSGRKSKTVVDSVEDFIKKNNIVNYQREKVFTGRSTGIDWRPHFYTTVEGNNVLTHVLSTSDKSNAKAIMCKVNTQWQDLESFKTESNYRFISLIVNPDEKTKIWTEGNKRILSKNSEVIDWSDKNNFKKALFAA